MAEKFHCPRCGNMSRPTERYCRSCGLALDGIGAIVNGNEVVPRVQRFRPHNRLIMSGVGLFIFGTILGLAHAALRDFDLFPATWGKMIFLLFVMAGLGCIGLGMLLPAFGFGARKWTPTTEDLELNDDSVNTTRLHAELSEPDLSDLAVVFPKDKNRSVPVEPGSVTDHTTRQLSNK